MTSHHYKYHGYDGANQFEYHSCELETTATSFRQIIWMFQVIPVTSDGDEYLHSFARVILNSWPLKNHLMGTISD